MQARWLLSAAGWCVLALQTTAAHSADETEPAADAAAQEAYQRAEAAYRAKDLPGALREMEQAYQLSQRVELLYNLARIEGELGQCAAARAHYDEYVERVPQEEARLKAAHPDELFAARCREAESAPPDAEAAPLPVLPSLPPPQAPPAERRAPAEPLVADHGKTQRWLGWSLVAGGVVAGVGAAYFLDATLDSRSALQASVDAQVAGGPRYDPELRNEQHRHQRTARVLGVSSAALLLGGAVVLLLAPRGEWGRRTALQLEPGLVAASYGQAF